MPEREAGLRAAAASLIRRRYRKIVAVDGISLSVQPGEVVGFIGPNGAGKTTTLKMLSGLLYPTTGEAQVQGYVPWERRPAYLQRIGMVMGSKSQMLWDIPPLDSFRVLGEIYGVPPAQLWGYLDELFGLLDMGELLAKPMHNLSLGGRMKCGLVAALGLVLRPELHVTAPNCLAFALALGLAWLLRFFRGYWLALLAFWATRADALLAVQDALIFLLAGQVAPVALLPGVLRTVAILLPSRYMLAFPVEVLTGQFGPSALLAGFGIQVGWLVVALALHLALWRAGLRRYSVVGG